MSDPKKKANIKDTVRKVEENLDMDPDSLFGKTLAEVVSDLLDGDDEESDDSDSIIDDDDSSDDDFGGGDFGGGGSSDDW
jgi:hypothetical protein